ncbi:MAG TPA: hypothetical protein VIJ06_01195 [Methylovirgula sp.]
MNNVPKEAAPIIDAIASGVPLGKVRPGEACPTLPAVPMMILIDDAKGVGPSAFDATKLFDQVDSVVIAVPATIGEAAVAVAARARTGDRALMVQAPIEAVAQWLALVSERRKLAHHFLLLCAGDVPEDVKLMLQDINALASSSVN